MTMPAKCFLSLFVLPCTMAAIAAHAGDAPHAGMPEPIRAGVAHVVPPQTVNAKFRTPEAIDSALADDLTRRLRRTVSFVQMDPRHAPGRFAAGAIDMALVRYAGMAPAFDHATAVPTGYAAGPMAIMRSDTTIHSWEQLRQRKVCLSADSPYAGTIASRYGAIEILHRAPADSLLALRTGACDAAVHDDVMLEELLKLPEWKKFSARLPTGPRQTLAILVPADKPAMADAARRVTAEWQRGDYLPQLMSKTARSIAFEVYLDQDVPDCH